MRLQLPKRGADREGRNLAETMLPQIVTASLEERPAQRSRKENSELTSGHRINGAEQIVDRWIAAPGDPGRSEAPEA